MVGGGGAVILEAMTHDRPAERYAEWGGHILFLALLLAGMAQALAGSAPIVFGGAAAVIAGVAVVGGWYLLGVWSHTRGRGLDTGIWVVILTLLWVALVLLSPGFVWLAFVLAMLCWYFLEPPVSVVAEVVIVTTSIGSTLLHSPELMVGGIIGPAFGIATAVAVTEIFRRIIAMVDERDELVADLLATRELLAAKERQAGILAERERLGGEIHDGTGQSLASIVLLLRSATNDETPGDQRDVQVRTALDTAQKALTESRRFLRGLDGPDLRPDGLTDALREEVDRVSQSGLPAELRVHGDSVALRPETRNTLLRTAQEALTNAARHAHATRATVTLTYLPDEVHLDVVDDGVGFPAGRRPPRRSDGSGFGLRAMQNRVSEAGGSVSVESEPDDGTVIHARLPIGGQP
ncbi:two-component sensor histidine kinase [Gordonia sihwensis]|nr:two-component sensor histidine kinase [Gordonia sihwensis]